MESSAMFSRTAAAAAPLPLYPTALLSLPDLGRRPPAVMEMWELEAVAAALPAKKRRLRETFDRLAACAPTPLPFRWEDLDTYISSLQYSVTLRHRQIRELEKPKPAPALAAGPAPPAAMSLLPVTGGGDVGGVQVPVLENPRPAHAPVLPVVLALPATDVVADVHELRGLVRSNPVVAASAPATGVLDASSTHMVTPAPPAPAVAVAAPDATGGHVEEGKKRKASIQEAEEVRLVKRTTHTQASEMRSRKILQEDAAARKKASPPHNSNSKESIAPAPQGGGDNGLAAKANASTDANATAVSKVAVLQPAELPEPAPATARDATPGTNRVRAAGVANSSSLQRSPPPRPVPASDAAASAADVTVRDLEKSRKRKVEDARQKVQMQVQHAVREVERRPHDAVVTTKNIRSHDGGEAKASPITVVVPPNYEVPDVEMEIVQPEEMPQVLKEDASMVARKARQTQVTIKSEEADKASAPPAPKSAGGMAAATRDAAAPKSAGGVPAATPDAPASHANRRAPPAAGSQQDGTDVSPVPPRGGNGLAQSSRVSAGTMTPLDSARDSAVVRQGAPAAGVTRAPAVALARGDLSATNRVPASGRERRTSPSEASAAPKAGDKHVLRQQHMPKNELISSPKKQQEWSSKNHGDRRPTGSRPVPKAQEAAGQRSCSRPGEVRGRGLAADRGQRRDDDNRNKDGFKGWRPLFCDRCGCKGHLAENCRTGKHLVALYQKAKEEREKAKEEREKGLKKICYRCGCTGHWSRNCRTAKHLVDLYQKDRAAKRAAGLLEE